MRQATAALPADLQAATESLAESLFHAEPILAYHHARSRLDSDPNARSLLDDLAQAQWDLRNRQVEGTVTAAAVDRVRTLQTDMQANELIMEYAVAQQAALSFLPNVNREISALIGLDFATLAGQGSC